MLDITSPLDLDTLDELVEAFAPLVTRAVQPYDGYVQNAASDRFEVFFGVPETQEDHAQRAVLAALTLRQQWEDLASAFGLSSEENIALRVGLHSGLVAVTLSEALPDLPLKIVGDVVALAAQIALQAEADQVVVSQAVAQCVHALVHLESQLPLAIASPFTLMPLYHVVSISNGPNCNSSWDGYSGAQFIGRASELELLCTCLSRATAGQGQIAAATGFPSLRDDIRCAVPGRALPIGSRRRPSALPVDHPYQRT